MCGFAGYLAGIALTTSLASWLGLGFATRSVIALAPPATFLIAVKAIKVALGYERIVFYQQALVTVGAAAAGVAVVGGQVARAIDLATLGVGTFLACGRIGCFRVACCHGRLSRRGVAYRDEHARAGFPARWVGRRVFPLQLVDGALAAAMVAVGTGMLLAGAAPGLAGAAFVCGYGAGRFVEELVRGDPARPTVGGVTEAQWTALATTAAATAWHPGWWTIAACGSLALATAAMVAARRLAAWPGFWFTRAAHVHEVGDQVDVLATGTAGPVTTSEGLLLSAARLPDGRLDLVVSRPDRRLPMFAVRALAAQLGGPWASVEVVAGRTPGLCHVILSPAPPPASAARGPRSA